MKKRYGILLIAALALSASGEEMRSWVRRDGTRVTASYLKSLFDDIVVQDDAGNTIRIPKASLSDDDLTYLELLNPPRLSLDFLKSERQEFVKLSPYIDPGKATPTILMYRFGARVKQLDTTRYSHPLQVVLYTFSQQRYDPDNYHLIAKIESKPFTLNQTPSGRFEFMHPDEVRLIQYDLDVDYLGWLEARGEKFAESLVLVVDQRGEIIASNSTKNWLMDNLSKVEKLPVGAWIDSSCRRIHPTPPVDTKTGEPIQ